MGHRTNTVNRPLSLLCYSSALTVEKRINQDSALAPEGGRRGGRKEEAGAGVVLIYRIRLVAGRVSLGRSVRMRI